MERIAKEDIKVGDVYKKLMLFRFEGDVNNLEWYVQVEFENFKVNEKIEDLAFKCHYDSLVITRHLKEGDSKDSYGKGMVHMFFEDDWTIFGEK